MEALLAKLMEEVQMLRKEVQKNDRELAVRLEEQRALLVEELAALSSHVAEARLRLDELAPKPAPAAPPELRGELKLSLPYGQADRLIGQDPMGNLEKLVEITINGHRYLAEVGAYAGNLDNGDHAKLYLDSLRFIPKGGA